LTEITRDIFRVHSQCLAQ